MPLPTSRRRVHLAWSVVVALGIGVAGVLLVRGQRDEGGASSGPPENEAPATSESPRLVGVGAGPASGVGVPDTEVEGIFETTSSSGDTVEWTKQLGVVVRALDDGTPVAGATVRVMVSWHPEWFREGTTDAGGRVTLEGPDRGPAVWVRAPGFLVQSIEFEQLADHPTDPVPIRLHRGAPLLGRVVRANAGGPVAGADVYVYDALLKNEIECLPECWGTLRDGGLRSDAEGRFSVAGVPEGVPILIAARAAGLGLAVLRLEAGSVPQEVVLELGEGGSLSGVATLDRGEPAAGARVYAVTAGEEHRLTFPDARWLEGNETRLSAYVQADATGRYRIEGLPVPGRYVAVAVGEADAQGASAPATLREAQAHEVRDIRLQTPAWIKVRGFAADRSPVELDDCDLATLDGQPLESPCFCPSASYAGGSNEYSLYSRPPGRWLLLARPKGDWRPARVPIEVKPGERKTVDVTFEPGLALEGLVVDASGRPIPDALIWCGRRSTYRPDMSDGEGRFKLEGLAEGDLFLTVRDERGFFEQATARATVPAATPVRIVLQPRPEVVGRIELVPGLYPWNGSAQIGTSDEVRGVYLRVADDGSFRLPYVPSGTPFDVVLWEGQGGIPWVRQGLQVEAGQRVDLGVVRIGYGRVVEGSVVDELGTPLPRAQVRIDDTVGTRSAGTDDAGFFRLHDAPEGAFGLLVRAPGRPEVRVSVGTGPPAPIRCPRGTLVHGALVGPDEDALACRRLRFVPRSDPASERALPRHDADTDSAGSFEVRLPPGTYDVFTLKLGDEVPEDRERSTRDRLETHVGQVEVSGAADVHATLRLP